MNELQCLYWVGAAAGVIMVCSAPMQKESCAIVILGVVGLAVFLVCAVSLLGAWR